MKTKLILFLIFLSFNGNAQNFYKFSSDIEKEIDNDKSGNDSYKFQIGAMSYSISNFYLKALQTWDKQGQKKKQISKEDSLKYTKYKMIKAKDYILQKSKNEEIIILNEAHHNASHRTFATTLLKELYANGYRYLGIETLDDDSINIRKYATIESGFYSSESQFGNFIKTALNLGFKLFKYEATLGKNGKEREIEEAQNIFNFMRNNTDGKYLIYCGYQHAYEGNHKTWEKTMAGRLNDLTGINPLTIDQTQYSEKSNPKFNEPLLRIVNNDYSVVLKDENEKVYSGVKDESYTDIKIIHPITKYIKGRPDWMNIENRKYYKVSKSKIQTFPLLVFAYRKGEYEKNGVAADIIELDNPSNSRFLILDKGNYEIIIKNRDYKNIERYEKTIK